MRWLKAHIELSSQQQKRRKECSCCIIGSMRSPSPSQCSQFTIKYAFMGPRLAFSIAPRATEKLGHHHVCHTRRGSSQTPLRTTCASFDCLFVKKPLVFVVPKNLSGLAPIPSTPLLGTYIAKRGSGAGISAPTF